MRAYKRNDHRAERSRVMWPARVRRFNEATWHGGVVLNLSLTGALVELTCRCQPGEWLAVDIEYPTATGEYGQYTRVGQVIRTRKPPSTVVAVGFVFTRSAPSVVQPE